MVEEILDGNPGLTNIGDPPPLAGQLIRCVEMSGEFARGAFELAKGEFEKDRIRAGEVSDSFIFLS